MDKIRIGNDGAAKMNWKLSLSRVRMLRSRKSILFTLGFVILALSVLSFARFMSDHSEDERILLKTETLNSRLYDLDSSVQNSVRDSFLSLSNIRIYISNSSIAIEEPLPNSLGLFHSSMSNLNNLSDSVKSGVRIDSSELRSYLSLYVTPQAIEYSHNISNDEIILFSPAHSSVKDIKNTLYISYNVSCEWDYSPGTFIYELEVQSPDDIGCDHSRSIDLSKDASITVKNEADPGDQIVITLSTGSMSLRLGTDGGFSADVRTEVSLNSAPENVWLGNDTVDITFRDLDVSRRGGVRII